MKRLAILGGMFNPVHLGHLLLAETALTQHELDGVLWVPSRYAHYKPSANVLSLEHRVEMIQRAIAPRPQFHLARLEQPDSGTSYALDLFQQLQTCHSQTDWHWIVGLDAFQSLPRWYGRHVLIQHCTWLVAPRFHPDTASVASFAGAPAEMLLSDWVTQQTEAAALEIARQVVQQGLNLRWRSLQMPLLPISSQMIRQYCQTQRSIRYFVPDVVHQYITTHQLYSVKPRSSV